MGSLIGQAKVRPVSWDAFEKVEPFTEAVKKQLAIMKAQRGVRVLPKALLPEATLDRVIMCIWWVCSCGMSGGRCAVSPACRSARCIPASRAGSGSGCGKP